MNSYHSVRDVRNTLVFLEEQFMKMWYFTSCGLDLVDFEKLILREEGKKERAW